LAEDCQYAQTLPDEVLLAPSEASGVSTQCENLDNTKAAVIRNAIGPSLARIREHPADQRSARKMDALALPTA